MHRLNRGFDCSFVATLGSGGLLSLLAAGLASLDGAGSRVLDVLLRGGSHEERGDVNHLFADGNVTASDQNTGVVDRGSQLALENESLQTSLHELRNGQTQNVIELAF